MKKATKSEKLKRVQKVYSCMILGMSRADIQEFANEQWELSESVIDNYIAEARLIFQKQVQEQMEDEYNLARTRLENLYKTARLMGDIKTALAVQKEINALLGLNAPIASTVTIEGGLVDSLVGEFQRLQANRRNPNDSD